MTSDLIQRAAAICGLDNPNSDQLAAWLDAKEVMLSIESSPNPSPDWWAIIDGIGARADNAHTDMQPTLLHCLAAAVAEVDRIEQPTLLHCLAAAVVEVDRIEREAAK